MRTVLLTAWGCWLVILTCFGVGRVEVMLGSMVGHRSCGPCKSIIDLASDIREQVNKISVQCKLLPCMTLVMDGLLDGFEPSARCIVEKNASFDPLHSFNRKRLI